MLKQAGSLRLSFQIGESKQLHTFVSFGTKQGQRTKQGMAKILQVFSEFPEEMRQMELKPGPAAEPKWL